LKALRSKKSGVLACLGSVARDHDVTARQFDVVRARGERNSSRRQRRTDVPLARRGQHGTTGQLILREYLCGGREAGRCNRGNAIEIDHDIALAPANQISERFAQNLAELYVEVADERNADRSMFGKRGRRSRLKHAPSIDDIRKKSLRIR
jgi:hypothetical protein